MQNGHIWVDVAVALREWSGLNLVEVVDFVGVFVVRLRRDRF
jgi:hypothetical protein